MVSRSRVVGLVLAALVLAAACSKKDAPKPKTKAEVFALFEKHKATYIRCEKLIAAERTLLVPVAAEATGSDAGTDAEAGPTSSAPAPSASAPRAPAAAGIRKSAPPSAPSAPSAGKSAPSAAASAPSAASAAASAPPVRRGEAQACHEDYFRELKKELGPYDQGAMDTWYAEWRQGVKIE